MKKLFIQLLLIKINAKSELLEYIGYIINYFENVYYVYFKKKTL